LKQKVFILYIIIYKVDSINKYLHLGKMQESFIQSQAKAGTKEHWLSDSGDRKYRLGKISKAGIRISPLMLYKQECYR
jgi:hypothetical protein